MAGTDEIIGSLYVIPEDGRYLVAAEAFAQLLRKTGGPANVAFEFGLPETTPPPVGPFTIADDRVIVDHRNHTVYVDETPADMTTKEYGLLAYLAHPTRVDVVQSRDQILTNVWEYPKDALYYHSNTSTVRGCMKRVRDILGPELGDPEYGALRTVFKVGYHAVSRLTAGLDAS
jgi:DNA-binding response OmpR family regulator